MGLMQRPTVTTLPDGAKYWEHEYERFYLKAYVPGNDIDGQVHNYTFRAPLLVVFEEHRQSMEEAISFAKESGFAEIAAKVDANVLFVYPTCEGGWKNATEELYVDFIGEVKMDPNFEDGIVKWDDFFRKQFMGYMIKGAKFRTDIYSYGASADYVANYLLKTINGEYLWGPGDITPAMCSMENLSVIPKVERKDIAILSVGNSDEINKAFQGCGNVLIKSKADYKEDFNSFVKKFKMWCGEMQLEPDFEAMNMTEEAGSVTVKTSPDNKSIYQNTKEHTVGYFAYYNKGIFDNGPAPLVIGFHGGGDSSMYFTFVTEWYRVAHKYGFLFVSVENHMSVTATEVMEVIEGLKKRYNIDEKRIYATGFSMGSCKTWELFQEYPETFAGLAPASALFPVKHNPLSMSNSGRFNQDVPVPIFYSGGEDSPLPELPFQADTSLERVQYAAGVNKLKAKFAVDYADKENWSEKIWGQAGERIEKLYDETRDSYLTIHYFDSEDGVCRTAFASVSGQMHELRHHSCENAWKFISRFHK
ncbi:MAG: hypothetical protein J6J79_01525 [Lachnospiraceae bacterium]|nr:hypothetical protein [Lachnospiraceae bacterium]